MSQNRTKICLPYFDKNEPTELPKLENSNPILIGFIIIWLCLSIGEFYDYFINYSFHKLLSQKLKDMGLKEVMLITDKIDENLYLSSRNLPNVMVVEVGHADPVSLLRYDKIIMTQSAVTKIEEMLS